MAPALVAAALSLAAVLLATRTATREPIVALLRRVPVRRHGWALGVADAIVVAVAAAGVLALVSGNLSGPLALATPALLALAVSARKRIDPEGTLWSSVLASTGQPRNLC